MGAKLEKRPRYIRRPETVADFYYRVLGYHALQPAKDGDYWTLQTNAQAEETDRSEIVRKLPDSAPDSPNFLGEFTVQSLVDCLEKVKVLGGRVDLADIVARDLGGSMAFCADPEGNSFSLFEPDNIG